MLKARYSDDAEPEYSSNNIHLSLALQKFETSLAAKLRSLSRKKEPSRSQRFISSRLLIDHFVFLLIGISHQSIKGTNNAYGHEDQSILFFSSKGDGENNSWQEAPCSLHKKEGGQKQFVIFKKGIRHLLQVTFIRKGKRARKRITRCNT